MENNLRQESYNKIHRSANAGKLGNFFSADYIFRTAAFLLRGKGARPGDSWRANSTSAAFRFRVISGFDIKAFLSESSDITRSRIQRMANSLLYNIKAIFRVRYRTAL